MILSFLPWVTVDPAPGPDMAELCESLNRLIEAQRIEIAELRRLLLEEKRISRDAARLAMEAVDDSNETLVRIVTETHRNLADRVAREEEHTL